MYQLTKRLPLWLPKSSFSYKPKLRIYPTLTHIHITNTAFTKLTHTILPSYSHQMHFSTEREITINEAIAKLRNFIDPRIHDDAALAFLYRDLGVLFYDIGDFNQSIIEYRVALKHDPKSVLTLTNLGNSLCSNDQYGKAKEVYEEALNIDPNYFSANANLARSLIDHEHYRQAIKYCKKAISINSLEPRPYANLGKSMYFSSKENPDLALMECEKSRKIDPLCAEGYIFAAQIYLDLKDYNNASQLLEAMPGPMNLDSISVSLHLELVQDCFNYQKAKGLIDMALSAQHNPVGHSSKSNLRDKMYTYLSCLNQIQLQKDSIKNMQTFRDNSLSTATEWEYFNPKIACQMSLLAYSNNLSDRSHSPEMVELSKIGWSEYASSKKILRNDEGYFSIIFLHRQAKKIVIAHQGTSLEKPESLHEDVYLMRASELTFLDSANQLTEELAKRFPDHKISHTGHSLGGAIGGSCAITFNQVGVLFDPPSFIDSYRAKHVDRLITNLPQLPIFTFLSAPNIVNGTLGKHCGDIYQIPIAPSAISAKSSFSIMQVFNNLLHNLGLIAKGLDIFLNGDKKTSAKAVFEVGGDLKEIGETTSIAHSINTIYKSICACADHDYVTLLDVLAWPENPTVLLRHINNTIQANLQPEDIYYRVKPISNCTSFSAFSIEAQSLLNKIAKTDVTLATEPLTEKVYPMFRLSNSATGSDLDTLTVNDSIQLIQFKLFIYDILSSPKKTYPHNKHTTPFIDQYHEKPAQPLTNSEYEKS